MTTSNYRPSVIETLYRDHKEIMDAAADVITRQEVPKEQFTGNRADRRRQQAKARKVQP